MLLKYNRFAVSDTRRPLVFELPSPEARGLARRRPPEETNSCHTFCSNNRGTTKSRSSIELAIHPQSSPEMDVVVSIIRVGRPAGLWWPIGSTDSIRYEPSREAGQSYLATLSTRHGKSSRTNRKEGVGRSMFTMEFPLVKPSQARLYVSP